MQRLGIEILDVAIVAIRPVPEMGRALEATAREALQRAADDAVYARRNAAVEHERMIRESELNTEIVVQEKQRTIQETTAIRPPTTAPMLPMAILPLIASDLVGLTTPHP